MTRITRTGYTPGDLPVEPEPEREATASAPKAEGGRRVVPAGPPASALVSSLHASILKGGATRRKGPVNAKYAVPFPGGGGGPIVAKYAVPFPKPGGGGGPVIAKYGVPFPGGGGGPVVAKYGVPFPGGGGGPVVAKYAVPFPGKPPKRK